MNFSPIYLFETFVNGLFLLRELLYVTIIHLSLQKRQEIYLELKILSFIYLKIHAILYRMTCTYFQIVIAYLSAMTRKSGKRTKGPKPFTAEDKEKFKEL
jgi:hypothetical protein